MTQVETNNILEFHGALTYPVIEDLLLAFTKKTKELELEFIIQKRLYSIMVECLENTLKYHFEINHPLHHHQTELSLSANEDILVLSIGNYVRNAEISKLVTKIDAMNALTLEEQNKLYRESIAKARISDKGGAGLGIIEIARNSRKQLKYFIHKEGIEFSFFIFEISLAKYPSKN
ncbi:MAG TPA: hypothetical protein DCQ26_17395 [Marinilabiliales bacterium]|jgi:hypothetical protein|nr:MAG: hypothetical protein A2W95_11800 [Bacteroidetes bacterium GWA2_40_14]OFX58633.1 MAG: hypothetical protein A2W84_10860 [Bacteroidetes bacterium GWC2_40_13]OFX75417.1 MAG: hypothetical protein A2W96_13365 [Bacteroidetes bacterium GWD2_40_43]OFX91955.1 MAG: hypothetical protein A2W97_15675 [Bacteroidetes bacterium GWE2_40_63]OFY24628.1 MAG: hypothetical protein A2W88_11110 [Bacteroidetes bacterium GWF2_40_13]OFZ26870.1 MAG: hypothetical protein A2437_08275 [Bacteroidetes bacterium RIFOXYC